MPIPRPPNEAAQTNEPSHVAPTAVTSTSKLFHPMNALSPRLVLVSNARHLQLMTFDSNLFGIDFIKDHPGTTVDEFKEVWRNVENDKVTFKVSISITYLAKCLTSVLQKYKDLSAQKRKEAKTAGATMVVAT